MAKSSVLETDSDGYLRAAEAPIICRNAIIFSFAERGVAGAGCRAAFAWNCSKRAFTFGFALQIRIVGELLHHALEPQKPKLFSNSMTDE